MPNLDDNGGLESGVLKFDRLDVSRMACLERAVLKRRRLNADNPVWDSVSSIRYWLGVESVLLPGLWVRLMSAEHCSWPVPAV
jgi:hypothetical protein